MASQSDADALLIWQTHPDTLADGAPAGPRRSSPVMDWRESCSCFLVFFISFFSFPLKGLRGPPVFSWAPTKDGNCCSCSVSGTITLVCAQLKVPVVTGCFSVSWDGFFFLVTKQLLNLWAGGSHVSIQTQQNSSNMLNHFMETSCPEAQGRAPLAGSCLLTVCASHTGGPGEDLQEPPTLQMRLVQLGEGGEPCQRCYLCVTSPAKRRRVRSGTIKVNPLQSQRFSTRL